MTLNLLTEACTTSTGNWMNSNMQKLTPSKREFIVFLKKETENPSLKQAPISNVLSSVTNLGLILDTSLAVMKSQTEFFSVNM